MTYEFGSNFVAYHLLVARLVCAHLVHFLRRGQLAGLPHIWNLEFNVEAMGFVPRTISVQVRHANEST